MKEVNVAQLNISAWRRVKETVRLRLFDLKDGSAWTVTAAIIAGKKGGPLVTIAAGQHGDEWNGTYIAHRLYEEIERQDLEGTLVILPVANPFAFLQKSRVSIIDQVDMNRSYGADGERQPTSLAASLLFEELFRKSDYVVDLHTGGPGSYLANVGVVEQGRFNLALSFNTGNIIAGFKDHGTLVAACERHSVPAFSLQLGRALEIDYEVCATTVGGLINFLRAVHLIPQPAKTVEGQQLFTGKNFVTAPDSGFVTFKVDIGQDIAAGEEIASIEPLFGRPVEVVAPEDGRVLYARRQPIVSRGDSLVHLAKV